MRKKQVQMTILEFSLVRSLAAANAAAFISSSQLFTSITF